MEHTGSSPSEKTPKYTTVDFAEVLESRFSESWATFFAADGTGYCHARTVELIPDNHNHFKVTATTQAHGETVTFILKPLNGSKDSNNRIMILEKQQTF